MRTRVVPDQKKATLQPVIRRYVEGGSEIFTDSLKSYEGLDADYLHEMIDHATEYVRGRVHTNGMENFWSLLKRMLGGTYIAVAIWHLYRYVDEQAWRFNNRKACDAIRFARAMAGIVGKRLTWAEAIVH